MSLKSVDWAIQHEGCRTPQAKLVLIVYANYLTGRSRETFCSAAFIARKTGLNIKTVRVAIGHLEDDGILRDTGARKGDTAQIKVYSLPPESDPDLGTLEDERPQKASRSRQEPPQSGRAKRHPNQGSFGKGSKVPDSDRKGTQIRVAEPISNLSPPNEAKASLPPGGGLRRGKSISPDWSPPPITDLPPGARAIAEQWPAGAYQAEAEGWRSARVGSGRGARDWAAAWAARVVEIGAKPLRDARAGMKHVARPTPRPTLDGGKLDQIDFAVDGEAEQLRGWRRSVASRIGVGCYRSWLSSARARVDGGVVVVTAPSPFFASHIQSELIVHLENAALAELKVQRVSVVAG